jgi:hypothetical protein
VLLDQYEEPLSREEWIELEEHQLRRLKACSRKALVSLCIFLLGCAAVVVFSAGHALDRFWDPFGKFLIIFCELMMMLNLYYLLLSFYAWKLLRETRKSPDVI